MPACAGSVDELRATLVDRDVVLVSHRATAATAKAERPRGLVPSRKFTR
jgi:hypothetical protein